MTNSFSTALLSVLSTKVYMMLVGFLLTPVLVRLLGPALYGQYAVMYSIAAVFGIFLTTGPFEALRKFIAERSNDEWWASIVGYIFRPALALSVVAAAACFLTAWTGVAALAFGPDFTSLFYILGLLLVANQLSTLVIGALMGLKIESHSEFLKAVEKTVFAICAVIFVYVGLGVDGVLFAHIVGGGLVTLVGMVFLGRRISLSAIVSRPAITIPKHQIVSYATNTVFVFLFLLSLYHVDVLLLQQWATDDVVGHYKGALVIAEVIWFAPIAVQLVLLQRVSHLWEAGDIDRIEQQARIATRYVFLTTLLLVAGLGVLATDFVILYLGESFRPAVLPLLLLLPGVLGFSLARPSLAINQARRSLRPLMVATGGCSIINLVLNLLLIPPFGMIGAAIATSVGYGSLVVFQALAARHSGYRPLGELRLRASLLTVCVTVLVIGPVSFLIASPILSLIVVPPLGLVVFVLTSIITGALTENDITEVLHGLDGIPTDLERQILLTVERIQSFGEW